jgi:hypothetical protein
MQIEFIKSDSRSVDPLIADLSADKIHFFFSHGHWSLHDLFTALIHKTGPAKVYLSTFSLSEVAVRSLYNASKDGLITELQCLVDIRVKRHKLGLLNFAGHLVDTITLANCHAKILILENDSWKIAVVASNNFTVNIRYESGSIITVPEIVDSYKQCLFEAIKTGIPYKLS